MANFAFADGSIRTISNNISIVTLQRLSARADGHAVDDNDIF
jgi:prepilin-type processing-associated H-X9-DG protein